MLQRETIRVKVYAKEEAEDVEAENTTEGRLRMPEGVLHCTV